MRRVSTKLWTPSLCVEAYNKTLFYCIITHPHLISHPPPTKKQPAPQQKSSHQMVAALLWTQRGMIPRPSDYESAALTN